jgi:hypothetical protein
MDLINEDPWGEIPRRLQPPEIDKEDPPTQATPDLVQPI